MQEPITKTIQSIIAAKQDLFDNDLTSANDDAAQPSSSHVKLTVGFGGSEQDVTVRSAAYIMPALEVARALNEQEISFCVDVFRAEAFSSLINGYDLNIVTQLTTRLFDYLTAYVDHFYPDIADRVTFRRDAPASLDTTMPDVRALSGLLAKADTIDAVKDTLTRMGAKHGGEEGAAQALLYAAAHPIYSGMIEAATHETRAPIILEFGGHPQRTFNEAGQYLAATVDRSRYTVRPWMGVIQNSGTLPPYYPAPYGDWILGRDKPSSGKFDRKARDDCRMLFRQHGEQAFLGFLNGFNKG